MITIIRDVRRARGLTLQDVADACVPPTTAQTIGRLETGMRTVSVVWLNRIAAAIGVPAADLVRLPEQLDLPVAAVLGAGGAVAPRVSDAVLPPRPAPDQVAIIVEAGVGDYRAGDILWCQRVGPTDFNSALNRDILVPRPAGRFLFGRLIGREAGMFQILPLGAGMRQQVLADPPWAAIARLLVRNL
jgi:transcriptional regulator with XRE-family HTH domain